MEIESRSTAIGFGLSTEGSYLPSNKKTAYLRGNKSTIRLKHQIGKYFYLLVICTAKIRPGIGSTGKDSFRDYADRTPSWMLFRNCSIVKLIETYISPVQ